MIGSFAHKAPIEAAESAIEPLTIEPLTIEPLTIEPLTLRLEAIDGGSSYGVTRAAVTG